MSTKKNKTKQKKHTKKHKKTAVPADYRVKIKESERRDMYLDFARELKKRKKKGTS